MTLQAIELRFRAVASRLPAITLVRFVAKAERANFGDIGLRGNGVPDDAVALRTELLNAARLEMFFVKKLVFYGRITRNMTVFQGHCNKSMTALAHSFLLTGLMGMAAITFRMGGIACAQTRCVELMTTRALRQGSIFRHLGRIQVIRM